MKIVFVSNFLNHHQLKFCENIISCGNDFSFIATENITNAGYQTTTETDYVVHWFKEDEKLFAEKLIVDADVAIFGACPNSLIKLRMDKNKLSFFYAERFFKKGTWRRFIPQTRKGVKDRIIQYKDKNIYILCASAYLPLDMKLLGFPENKFYKWGYFPEVKKYDDIDNIISKKEPNSILWVARIIALKHPETIISVAKRLKKEGYQFHLNVVGDGPLKTQLEKEIIKHNLSKQVCLVGSVTPEKVREYMEKSEIFFFTSNRKEGWGAVLNESMNGGCAVVSNSIIGSTRFLIDDGKTGLIYKNGNVDDLYNKIKYLLDNPEKRKELQKNAYASICENWNVDTATERFLNLIEDINEKGESSRYEYGPCSKAEVVKEKW